MAYIFRLVFLGREKDRKLGTVKSDYLQIAIDLRITIDNIPNIRHKLDDPFCICIGRKCFSPEHDSACCCILTLFGFHLLLPHNK